MGRTQRAVLCVFMRLGIFWNRKFFGIDFLEYDYYSVFLDRRAYARFFLMRGDDLG
ncbi:MAG: hypothetical protein Q6363_008240 [Candidatus Njordarchaeota archaeon]